MSAPPVDRAARAATLGVEPVDTTHFRVTGGQDEHRVLLHDDGLFTCDCPDHGYRHVICAHILAVQQSVEAADGLSAARTPGPSVRPPRYQLVRDDELAAQPPPLWLLEHWLTEGGLSVLYGPPGAGKTFLALDWAFAIARGQAWHGTATRAGSVVYVAAEGGHGLAARVATYRQRHQIAGPTRLLFLNEPVHLLNLGDVDAFMAALDQQVTHPTIGEPEHPAMVVLDTFARSLVGGDENSARDVGLAIAAADAIRRHTDAHVQFVHHTQKAGELERGSSALRAAADTMLLLTADGLSLTLECTKQKDAPAIEPQALRLVPVGTSCVVEPETRHPADTPLTPSQERALAVLRDLTYDDQGAPYSKWEGASEMKPRSFAKAVKALLSAQKVVKGEGRNGTYRPSLGGDNATPF